LIFVLAETATRVLPHGSFVAGVGPSTAKYGQVALDGQFSVTILIADELKRRVGYFSMSKKSGLLRSIPLLIAGMNGGCLDGGLESRVRQVGFIQKQRTRNLGKLAFHIAIIMCLTLNSATE
jgi:hypothetical protein